MDGLLLPKYWLSVHRCQIEIQRQSFGGKRNFISLPGKAGQNRLMPWKIVSPLGEDSEKFYSNGSKRVWSAPGHSSNGLVLGVSIINLQVQLVWGLQACGQHNIINPEFLPPGGGFSIYRISQRCCTHPFLGNQDLASRLYGCFSWVFVSLLSCILSLP